MPLMHCMKCVHEWESTSSESLCGWCGSAGYILSPQTELEKMVEDLSKHPERIKNGLPFGHQPSIVETPADRVWERKEMLKEITDEEARVYMAHAEERLMNGTLEPMSDDLQEAFDAVIDKQWAEFREKFDGDIGTCGIDIGTTEGKAKILMAYAASEENIEYEEQ